MSKNQAPTTTDVQQRVLEVEQTVTEHPEMLELFKREGHEVMKRGNLKPEKYGSRASLAAIAYSLGTYQTRQSQVDEAWNENISNVRTAEWDDFKKFLGKTSYSGGSEGKVAWFREIVENQTHVDHAKAFFNGRRKEARKILTNSKGFAQPKAGMVGLLLGDDEAFVLDTNVRKMAADRLRTVHNLRHMPVCPACDNAHTRPSSDVDFGDYLKSPSYLAEKSPTEKKNELGAYTKAPYFETVHLKDHIGDSGHFGTYKEETVKWVNDVADGDYTPREVTQLLFNAGMKWGEGLSDTDIRRFDVHASFYRTA